MDSTGIILSGGFDPVHKGHIRMFKAAKEFPATVRIDTPREWDYFLNGGILPYVVRQLLED